MRLSFSFAVVLVALTSRSGSVSAFAPSSSTSSTRWTSSLLSSSSVKVEDSVAESVTSSLEKQRMDVVPFTEAEINARLGRQMEKLQEKDRTSTLLSKEDLQIVYEDDDIVVVDKPSGVLSVPGKIVNPSLAQSVFDAIGCEMGRMDMMVVHRLGMDTSGLMVMAKTMEAVRGMNTVFRTRAIERKYEALVCGHIEMDSGIIDLPLMRDYEYPPFMRVSTEDHQRALVDLDPEQLTLKKILDMPKESVTKYKVIAREELNGLPVTRVALTSLSGRTHQLNVHLAAFGHPIVGDSTYGVDGDAASNGGLSEEERDVLVPNANRASEELQRRIAMSANGKMSRIHAKSLKFCHPASGEEIAFVADAPF